MARKLFCEISPLTYQISTLKCTAMRHVRDAFSHEKFAKLRSEERLSYVVYKHNSLVRRRLGNVNMELQENKAINLGIAVPKVNGIVIRPGETFSFWRLVGSLTPRRGYKEGLTIARGVPISGIGGGMCQFTNLIHWMVLHTPLTVTEHHHHDGVDLFPDFNRQIPFGTGTSILYNYLDYRFKNNTDVTFQMVITMTDEYLCGEICADAPMAQKMHIKMENERFIEENGEVYRVGQVWREVIDGKTGNCIERKLVRENHARVLYDTTNLVTSKT